MSESDEDVFASYGTLLEPYNDDEIPKKKAFNIEDQVATDAQGRRRFHGAFTGGFSAGFFNTVGSLEGWRPAEFKSSRAEKAERKLQKASDFMDEEDLGEFGIAPTQVRATSDYAPAQVRKRVMKPEGPIPGVPVLHSFLQPAKDTVGIKLLKKMGWKPGQGIGPRLSKAEKLKANREHRMNAGRVYGCEIPEEFLQKVLEEEESSEDETELTFAPDDYDPFIYQPKDNSFGMGYSGLDKRPILSGHVALFADFEMKDRNNKKISISGQAFGVGAFEHEDEDIYTKDDMTKYDFEMDTPSKSKKKSPKKISQSSEKILDGFVIARVSIAPKKAFVPPVLPKNFIPKHGVRISRFEPLPETHKLHNYDRKKTMGRHDLTATQRSKIINSDSNKSIVTNKDFVVGNIKTCKINLEISKNTIERTREFALANTSTIDLNKGGVTTIKEFVTAKLDMSNTNSELNKNPIETPNKIVIANISATINKKSVTSQEFVSATLDTSVVEENKSLLEKASKITSTLPSTSTNVFKPFITNPDKQKRYEQYQSFIKLGQREKLSEIQPASLSDWEKEHERYEFEQAARLYRPQTGLIFNKFVAATEQEDINNPLKRLGKSIFEHGTQEIRDAAKMKMFGHLTREIEVWIPHKILCKRFNIPEPEISDVEMLQSCKKKKGKFSVFDYYEAHQQNKIIKEGPEPRKQPEQSDNIPNPDNKDPLIPSSSDTNNMLTTNTDNKSNSMQILELEPKLNTNTQQINTFANIDIPSTSSYLEDLFTAEPTEQIPMPVTEPNVVQKVKLPEPKIVIPADPKAKLDLFKAIFLSSSESEGETEEKPKTDRDKIVELKKIVLDEDNLTTTSSKRETKPNKGIFADLDWSQVNRNRSEDKMKKPEPEVKKIIDDNSYGPKLPVINPEEAKAPIWKPSFTKVKTANEKICISSDDEWMEIGSEKSNKKSNKKHKKHKSEKSKEKSKHKKHKSKHKKKKHSDKD